MARRPRTSVRSSVLDPQTRWTRRKLQGLLAGVVVMGCGLVAGSVWAVSALLTHDDADAEIADPVAGEIAVLSPEDELAAEALTEASLVQAQPGALSTAQIGSLYLPPATTTGEAAVASGFPRTPEGAMAQLAAINRAAFTSASVRTAQEVIEAWAEPGGPDGQAWSGVQALAALLSSAGVPAEAQNSIAISLEPAMGFIKGSVGDEFTVACIDYVLQVALPDGMPREVAVADCQRMQWVGSKGSGRWMIGAGVEPAEPPALWPGTQASFDAGYLWLEVER